MEFEGIIGSSFESDMAIDDLYIYEVQTLDSNTCAFAPSAAKPVPSSTRPPNTPSARPPYTPSARPTHTPSAWPPHTATPTVGYCKYFETCYCLILYHSNYQFTLTFRSELTIS